ncbi:cytochrome b5 [Schizopora paradoxa]|uniref:Cytochrome b5 n=1 Tax=Schizopora paradoxa TaxID=27342 RepID=A0A0H2RRR5_9AGAM|nr:cytochrome b5 [Schizopora paradoxa]
MSAEETTKIVTLAELQENSKREKLYILLHGKVYNVTNFIDEHPGGDEVVLAEAGKDATEAFEDVGHSDEARGLLKDMFVGDFETGAAETIKSTPTSEKKPVAAETASSMSYFLPLTVLVGYFAWRFYTSGSA